MGSLYILPSYQGQGIGSALIHAMAGHLYKQGSISVCCVGKKRGNVIGNICIKSFFIIVYE